MTGSHNVLLIGGGGREHALAQVLAQSESVRHLYVTPGNPGMRSLVTSMPVVDISDHAALVSWCKDHAIDLVVVGPEAPLVEGVADALRAADIAVFGPNKDAAAVEGSKRFMKDLATRAGVPTAKWQSFTDQAEAEAYITKQGAPIVVKTDGLAAGKGVTVAQTEEEALVAVRELFSGKFGEAGHRVVIEEFLEGEELSFFALCDGEHAVAFGSAQDHKAVGEGDTGPNTGGMGTYAPAPLMDAALEQRVMEEIIAPTLALLKEDGMPYCGVLFAGLMVDAKGNPRLIEFNIRFGDPEAQVLLPQVEGDFAVIVHAAATGQLDQVPAVTLSGTPTVCVVLAAKGYPGAVEKGSVIYGLDRVRAMEHVRLYHAGTAENAGGQLVANGGRVLGVVAQGNSITDAKARAYRAVDAIEWPEGFCRRDIGWRAVEREKTLLAS